MAEPQNLQEHRLGDALALSDLFHDGHESIVSGERRGHDDAGLGAHLLREFPSGGQGPAAGKRLFLFHQGKPCICDGLVGGGNGHACRVVPTLVPLARYGVVVGQGNLACLARPGHDLVRVGDGHEIGPAVGRLVEPLHSDSHDSLADVFGNGAEHIVAFEESVERVVLEQASSTGKAHGEARDPDVQIVEATCVLRISVAVMDRRRGMAGSLLRRGCVSCFLFVLVFVCLDLCHLVGGGHRWFRCSEYRAFAVRGARHGLTIGHHGGNRFDQAAPVPLLGVVRVEGHVRPSRQNVSNEAGQGAFWA